MKIFISWSGQKSHIVAKGLRDAISKSSQEIEPWMSSESIELGSRWADRLASNLEDIDAGVLCFTSENLNAPWIIFEAGALFNSVKQMCIIPYLLDIKHEELPTPLRLFQSVDADKDGTFKLLERINNLDPENRPPPENFNRLFLELIWPNMDRALDDAKGAEHILEQLVLRFLRDDDRINKLYTAESIASDAPTITQYAKICNFTAKEIKRALEALRDRGYVMREDHSVGNPHYMAYD
jgi:hypothetical protein